MFFCFVLFALLILNILLGGTFHTYCLLAVSPLSGLQKKKWHICLLFFWAQTERFIDNVAKVWRWRMGGWARYIGLLGQEEKKAKLTVGRWANTRVVKCTKDEKKENASGFHAICFTLLGLNQKSTFLLLKFILFNDSRCPIPWPAFTIDFLQKLNIDYLPCVFNSFYCCFHLEKWFYFS